MKKVFAIALIVLFSLTITAFLIFLANWVLKSAFGIPMLTIKQCFALAFIVGVLKSLFATKKRN